MEAGSSGHPWLRNLSKQRVIINSSLLAKIHSGKFLILLYQRWSEYHSKRRLCKKTALGKRFFFWKTFSNLNRQEKPYNTEIKSQTHKSLSLGRTLWIQSTWEASTQALPVASVHHPSSTSGPSCSPMTCSVPDVVAQQRWLNVTQRTETTLALLKKQYFKIEPETAKKGRKQLLVVV